MTVVKNAFMLIVAIIVWHTFLIAFATGAASAIVGSAGISVAGFT